MEIRTAWKLEAADERPWLVASACEVTEYEHGGIPQFYLDAVENARGKTGDGSAMREVVLLVHDDILEGLFDVTGTTAHVIESRDL